EDGVDALLAVDHLDHQREILRQSEDAGGVEVALGTEALDGAQHRRPGDALLAQAPHDGLVQRLAVPRVGLADEDPQQLALALELHTALPTTTPTHTPRRPPPTDSPTLSRPSPKAPSPPRR